MSDAFQVLVHEVEETRQFKQNNFIFRYDGKVLSPGRFSCIISKKLRVAQRKIWESVNIILETNAFSIQSTEDKEEQEFIVNCSVTAEDIQKVVFGSGNKFRPNPYATNKEWKQHLKLNDFFGKDGLHSGYLKQVAAIYLFALESIQKTFHSYLGSTYCVNHRVTSHLSKGKKVKGTHNILSRIDPQQVSLLQLGIIPPYFRLVDRLQLEFLFQAPYVHTITMTLEEQ